mmetsp:Transcript_35981/g.83555  ORF Transcript_35981/g.83555 Transcript_35981/m.83555 type:complete len:89 (+) Transcript_35981:81-347(+)
MTSSREVHECCANHKANQSIPGQPGSQGVWNLSMWPQFVMRKHKLAKPRSAPAAGYWHDQSAFILVLFLKFGGSIKQSQAIYKVLVFT